MKESRYIELLNLYVDQQISPEEAAELEAEVQRSPERRRLYAQYCRMHKGCTLLFEAERSHAPKTAAAILAAERPAGTVVAFPGNPFVRGLYAAGAVAAAACVVLVAMRWSGSRGPAPAPLAGTTVATTNAVSAPIGLTVASDDVEIPVSIPVASGPRSTPFKSVLVASAFQQRPADARVDFGDSALTHLNWINRVDLKPVKAPSADDFRFNPNDSLAPTDNRTFGPREATDATVEMTAFRLLR